MRFLADESCDFAVVRAMRAAGHDVVAVMENSQGAEDEAVIRTAIQTGRVLITEDRDFGRLIYTSSTKPTGVLYIRYPAGTRRDLASAVSDAVAALGSRLTGKFVTLQPRQIRIREYPD